MPKPKWEKFEEKIQNRNYTIGFQVVNDEKFQSLLGQIYNPGSNPSDSKKPDALVICRSEPPIIPWPD